MPKRRDGLVALLLISLLVITACAPKPPEGAIERVVKGTAAVVDLTYPYEAATNFWPGGTPFHLENLVSYDQGYYLNKFTTGEHTGTHIDAPAHFIEGAPMVDAIPLRQLFGPAVVVNVVEKVEANPDYLLTKDDLLAWEKENGKIPDGAIVLMYTGWGEKFWSDPDRYRNMDASGVMHFPGFSEEAAKFLTEERNINGIGIDTLSLDYGPSPDFIVHVIMLKAGKWQLENLANLGKLPAKGAYIIAAPMLIKDGSGAPTRVLAILP